MSKLLEIKNLCTYFHSDDGIAKAVDGVSFDVDAGKTLGIVGESGCGKTVSCLTILRLIQIPPGEIAGGEIIFKGSDLLKVTEEDMRGIRGNEIAMIFQEPMTSLNPVFTCGNQVIEAVTLHQHVTVEEARQRALEMFKFVGIPDPERRLNEYPHQLSGGLRQRVMIAMALSCHPSMLICDEPTTALDVTIQAQILSLLRKLQKDMGMAIIMITHDLGVIAEMADRVVVMYAGKMVEAADAHSIFHNPQHPYTIGLQHAIPRMGTRKRRLYQIDGTVPSPLDFPSGCKFHPRCPLADDNCRTNEPELKPGAGNSQVACWKTGMFANGELFTT
ncbi:MAG: ABC transporter ATP-binding protein [Candidatus Hatepunaea meridiana]|nr:ABC transporter ATP-binding protein [Candidatus Hatepunaea meridiana]